MLVAQIRLDTRRIMQRWLKLPDHIRSVVLYDTLHQGVRRMRLNIRPHLPIYSGKARASLAEDFGGKAISLTGISVSLQGRVYTDLSKEPALPTILYGRPPGSRFPNIRALAGWVLAHGLPKRAIYPIARMIATLGHTDGHPSQGPVQIPSYAMEIGAAESITPIKNIFRNNINRAFRNLP